MELKKNHYELIIIFECDKKISDFVNKEKLEIINFTERKKTINFLKKLKLIDEKNIYISDILDADAIFENLIRRIGFFPIIHLNDSGLNNFKPDVLIDGDIFFKKWNLKDVQILQSPKYHIVKNDIVKNRPQNSWNKSCAQNILVCFGGTDPARYTEMLINELKNEKCNLNFNIILGPGFSEKRIEKIMRNHIDNVVFYKNVNDIYKFILNSDIVLSLGGGIAYESMCLGIPTAAIPWGNMRFYVENMDDMGVLKKISKCNIIEELRKLSCDIHQMKKIAFNGWKLVDGKASKRIVDYIKSI